MDCALCSRERVAIGMQFPDSRTCASPLRKSDIHYSSRHIQRPMGRAIRWNVAIKSQNSCYRLETSAVIWLLLLFLEALGAIYPPKRQHSIVIGEQLRRVNQIICAELR